jgi:hypothetical protein
LVAATTRTFAFNSACRSQSLELALLQDAKELGLCGCAHLGDFVEKKYAARRQLDLPGLGLLRARKRATLVAEELGFEQLLGERRAIQRTNGPFARFEA